MIIQGLTNTGDWQFGQGLNQYLTKNAAIGLNIQTRLLSWVGDCFFDTAAGIDWLNRLGSKGQEGLLELDLRRVILQSYGVTGINNFSYSLTGRSFSASYDVNTIFSQNYQNQIMQDL